MAAPPVEEAIHCTFSADGVEVHGLSAPLDASLNTVEHPLGAVERVLEDFKLKANAYMSTHVESERAALGAGAANDDGWHELNDEAAGASDEEEDKAPVGKGGRGAEKTKRPRK